MANNEENADSQKGKDSKALVKSTDLSQGHREVIKKEVLQLNNQADGDIVAGDKINYTTLNLNVTNSESEYLKDLYEKLENEALENEVLKQFIQELDYFNSEINDGTFIGLEKKLEAGKRGDIFWYAKEVKERYHKKLMATTQFSVNVQKINVYLLATVRSYYILEIYPLICKEVDEQVINTLINEKIVKPLMIELGRNCLGFTPDDIQGMLYFLTGNCHIKWNN